MPNDDYIKRSDAHKAIFEWCRGTDDRRSWYNVIDGVPAADVEPVRHGRWIDENPESFWDPLMHCSVCGEVNIPIAKWRFCPICGAKMDKEEDDV